VLPQILLRTLRLVAVTTAFAAASPASAGIIVNLGKVVVDLGPDGRTTRQLEIANTNDKPADISVFPSDWAQDEKGAVDAIDAWATASPDSAAAWIGVNPQRFTLAKGEKKLVTISIATPKGAGEMPLKEYRAMVFTETTDTNKSQTSAPGRELQVRVIGRIGTKLFIRNPRVAAKADCEVTKMEQVDVDGKRAVSIRAVNNGNVHVQSDNATITFRDAAGAAVETMPLPPFSILPGKSRVVTFTLPEAGKSKLQPGKRYNALAVIDYGGSDLVAGEIELTY
jgi:P pilus assembly chaperone PapD